MLRRKWAWYTHEIVKDGSCVNQNVVKCNMEARNNYLLEKKGTKKSNDSGRASITDSYSKKRSKTSKARGNNQVN